MSKPTASAPRRGSPRRRWLALAFAMVATLAFSAPAAAVSWMSMTQLRNAAGAALQDADFNGHSVAVVWDEPGGTSYVRGTVTADAPFSARHALPGETRQAELDTCGDQVYVAYARNYPPNWLIDLARGAVDGADFLAFSAISSEEAKARFPDVTCAGGRLFVSWESKVGSEWRLYVDNALRTDLLVTATPVDLGPVGDGFGKPAVAGVSHRAYAVWQNASGDGQIKFNRWSVGGGPGYPVADLGDRVLASDGDAPAIAADGDKVVVAWHDCGDIKARVSNDRGASWGPVRTIFTGACGSEFGGIIHSVAINGSRIVVSYLQIAGFDQEQRYISTRNDFVTLRDRHLWDDESFLLGFVVDVGAEFTHLAGAVDEGSRIRYFIELVDEPCC